MIDGVKYELASGRLFKRTVSPFCMIDPRGHFTMIRSSLIMVIDKIMCLIGYRKPFPEFCEFLANYPTW
jgi:hypothetical protein